MNKWKCGALGFWKRRWSCGLRRNYAIDLYYSVHTKRYIFYIFHRNKKIYRNDKGYTNLYNAQRGAERWLTRYLKKKDL